MQIQKSIIVYYDSVAGIDKSFINETEKESSSEIFVIQEHHREEVPGEYYNNPEEYYRLKFKQRGYDVILQTYKA